MGKSKSKSTAKDTQATAGAAPPPAPPAAAGLSSFLLGQANSKDSALDDVFATSVRLPYTP